MYALKGSSGTLEVKITNWARPQQISQSKCHENLQIWDIREISISRSLVNSVLKTRVAVAAAVVVVNLVPYPVFRSLLRDSDVTIILNILGV